MWQKVCHVHSHTEIYIKFGDVYLLTWGLLFICLFTYLGFKNTHHTVSKLQAALKGLCL